MKQFCFFSIVVICALTGCSQPASKEANSDVDRQIADYGRQMAVVDQNQERTAKQLDETDKQLQRSSEQADRLEKLIDRWEAQADRQDKIFDSMQRLVDKISGATTDSKSNASSN